MTEYKVNAAHIKTNLFRLHFLLTEPENDEIIKEGLKQFKVCFKEVFAFLANYLSEEYNVTTRNNRDVLSTSFEKKMFTKDMTNTLQEMEKDFRSINSLKNSTEMYLKVKRNHAHHLQLIYDMITKMGEEPEE